MYQISFHHRTDKKLKKLTQKDRKKILTKIYKLRKNPVNKNLDIKPYHNAQKSWHIRAGDLRAIYTFDSKEKIIHIEYLGFRGSIY